MLSDVILKETFSKIDFLKIASIAGSETKSKEGGEEAGVRRASGMGRRESMGENLWDVELLIHRSQVLRCP